MSRWPASWSWVFCGALDATQTVIPSDSVTVAPSTRTAAFDFPPASDWSTTVPRTLHEQPNRLTVTPASWGVSGGISAGGVAGSYVL